MRSRPGSTVVLHAAAQRSANRCADGMNSTADHEVVIRLPQPASPPPTSRFPIVAVLAPVVVSVALFAVTGSPMTLLFAVLGPVTAIASVADAAIGGRRHSRRERARLDREVESAHVSIAAAHATELEHRRAAVPSGVMIVRDDPRARLRWNSDPGPIVVTIGTGIDRSSLRVEGVVDGDDLVALAATASTLHQAPMLASAADGIGVVGPLPLARAVARGLALQVIVAVSPTVGAVEVSGPAFAAVVQSMTAARLVVDDPTVDSALVISAIAPRSDGGSRGGLGDGGSHRRGGDLARIVVAGDQLAVASTCATIVTIDGTGATVSRSGRAGADAIAVQAIDHAALTAWCEAAAAHAPSAGSTSAMLPASAQLADIVDARPPGSVGAVLGVGADGVVAVDLARHGPHAVVGGTTGSGKSELLLTWVASMAAGASPSDLAVLLIDFKGGAGFAPIARLPHVVGIVTDLNEAGALRAVGSLRAEMRRREGVIAAAGLREHSPEIGLPRLVIVVDEYAALVDLDAGLHAVFGDLAARGRSLGIHLIVGTQRPAASVRDAVLANADVRVSLRVRDRADGLALVGSSRPAELPAEPRGRAIASIAGEAPVELQVAAADPLTIDRIIARWHGAPRPSRPWRDPLPAVVTPASLAAVLGGSDAAHGLDSEGNDRHAAGETGLAGVIGVLDRPERQRIEPWIWNPRHDGVLLAIGAAGCGRSGLLAAIEAVGPSIRIGAEPASAWDALADLTEATGDHGGLTLLIDDLDVVLDAFDPEHRQVWLDRLVSLCRRRRELGIGIAVTAVNLDGALRAIEPHVTTRVLMRMPSRQDHRLAGGDGSTWDATMAAGGAIVNGVRAQVIAVGTVGAVGGVGAVAPARVRSAPPAIGPIAIIAGDASNVARALSASSRTIMTPADALTAVAMGGLADDVAVVGDSVAWQARWDAIETLSQHATVMLHGLSTAQARAVSGRRELPPPLPASSPSGDQWCWQLAPGRILRARLPH